MKFIGQFIQDFIARFRNDVYLEDVDAGTIASGGNLGLDSNNKIVKANVPTTHDAVTLAGSLDYITLSGQEITRNAIDLAADVTGTLPVGNGGTGVTSLGSINISDLNNDSGFTSNTGDITGIGISDGSTTLNTTSGTHTTQFLAGEGIDVSINQLSATVKQVTHSAEDASTSNKGVASFNSSDFSVSSGAVSLGTKYAYQYISFVGNVTANTSGNGYWEHPGPNGISNHTWNQIVQTTTGSVDNRDTTTVGDNVGIDRLNQGSAGIRIPYAGTIVGFTGSGRNASGNRAYYGGLFVGTPDWGTTNKIDAELVAVAQADNTPGGSYTSRASKVEDLSRSYSISAGDVIYPAIKGDGTNADTIQVSFTIVIKTSIV